MKIHIISMFPDAFESYFESSIIGRAKENNLFEVFFYKINDFSTKKFKQADDKAYGMHGQVISPEPVAKAIEFVFDHIWKKVPIIYMTPRGKILTQEQVENFYKTSDEYIILCGHYEGIDQRIIDLYVNYEVSIWEYILSSGELSAMVLIDSLIRHIPWVLGNKISLEEESFSQKLNRQKEYPVYTRPQEFMEKKVPEVLMSWNHKEIEQWKKKNLS